jgi:two-component system cell cycle response regulator DivK
MKKILLVDDEEQLISVMADFLQDEGFAVKTMLSAEEALNAYASYAPDLVVSDVNMDHMDGFEMFEQVKALQSYKSVPFIFLTGFDDPLDQQRAESLGATAYVKKPFDMDEFVGIVKKLIPPQ